jgi:hypothetical protein
VVAAAGREEDVVGLEVAVDNVCAVCGLPRQTTI